MERLLILGTNQEMVSLIEEAKEMGLYTLVTEYGTKAYENGISMKRRIFMQRKQTG